MIKDSDDIIINNRQFTALNSGFADTFTCIFLTDKAAGLTKRYHLSALKPSPVSDSSRISSVMIDAVLLTVVYTDAALFFSLSYWLAK